MISEKKKGSVYLEALKGLFAGFFSMIPFVHQKSLERVLTRREEKGFNDYFKSSLPYLIAFSLTAVLFFYIPLETVWEQGRIGFVAGMIALALILCGNEIYDYVKTFFNSKKVIIASAINFAIPLLLTLPFFFITLPDPVETSILPFLITALLLVSSFFSSLTGLSISAPLVASGLYLTYGSFLRTELYASKTNIVFYFVLFFLAILSGDVLAKFFQPMLKPYLEKQAFNTGFYFSCALGLAITQLKGPWHFESEVFTPFAQNIVILTTLFAFVAIGLVFTLRHIFALKGEKDEA